MSKRIIHREVVHLKHDPTPPATADRHSERTSCCGAQATYDMDAQELYCKRCFGPVTWA